MPFLRILVAFLVVLAVLATAPLWLPIALATRPPRAKRTRFAASDLPL